MGTVMITAEEYRELVLKAYKLIGERAEELSKREDVQKKMVEIANKDGKAEAEKWLYRMAIVTLM